MPPRSDRWPLYASGSFAVASAAALGGVIAWRASVMQSPPVPDPTRPDVSITGEPEPADPDAAGAIEAVLDAADSLVRDGEFGRAEAAIAGAIARHPGDQELRLAHAGVLVMLERHEEAYRAYEAALAIGPRTPETEFNAGTLALRLNLLERAEEHFSAAQAADGSDARFPLYLAQVLIRRDRAEEARKNLLIATRLDENLAIAWGSLAELSLRDNEPTIAQQLAARARALEPEVAAWRVIEARALNRLGRAAESAPLLEALSDESRHTLPVLRLLGETYGMLREPERAAAEFESAALARPADGELLFETAVWMERAGRSEDALRYARAAGALGIDAGDAMATRLAAEPDG